MNFLDSEYIILHLFYVLGHFLFNLGPFFSKNLHIQKYNLFIIIEGDWGEEDYTVN